MLRSALVKVTQVAKPFASNATLRPIQAAAFRSYSTASPTVSEGGPTLEERRMKDVVEELRAIQSTPVCGYETRRIYQDIHDADSIPEPEVISEFMRTCRACNDFALAIRILESIKRKCGKDQKVLWPYIAQEIRPTLDELGYDKPELYMRKCGKDQKVLWPYIAQEIRPTLDELGIPLPEEMGYDKPELYLESVFDIH